VRGQYGSEKGCALRRQEKSMLVATKIAQEFSLRSSSIKRVESQSRKDLQNLLSPCASLSRRGTNPSFVKANLLYAMHLASTRPLQ
jgi:hypothetical protein